MSAYYYLVSSLPELSAETDLKRLDIPALTDLVLRNLSPADRQAAGWLMLPTDHQLLFQLSRKGSARQGISELTDRLACFSVGYWQFVLEPTQHSLPADEDRISAFSEVPAYLAHWLDENREAIPAMNHLDFFQSIAERYHSAAARSGISFISRYTHFVRRLENFRAVWQSRQYGYDLATMSVTLSQNADPEDEQLLQSGAVWLREAREQYLALAELETALSTDSPVRIRQAILKAHWAFLYELANEKDAFASEAVLSWFARLLLLVRYATPRTQSAAAEPAALQNILANMMSETFIPNLS